MVLAKTSKIQMLFWAADKNPPDWVDSGGNKNQLLEHDGHDPLRLADNPARRALPRKSPDISLPTVTVQAMWQAPG